MKNTILSDAGWMKRIASISKKPIVDWVWRSGPINILLLLIAAFLCRSHIVRASDMTAKLKDDTSGSGFSITNASGTITARFRGDGKAGIGTTTPSTTLHVIGTVTATGFVGDGSQLTGISASSVGANSVSSSSIIDGSITGSDLASNISISTTGTISVASGNFVVDSNGSITASSISTTGTMTITGSKVKTYSGTDTNTFVGIVAGSSNTTGYNNTAYGYQALKSNTTGTQSVAIGIQALYSNTTGYENLAIGNRALYSNTSGLWNLAVGEAALASNTTGNSNTAIGLNALLSNTTGYSNTAVGQFALNSNTTGYYNTAQGQEALYSNTTGYHNTAVGFGAGSGTTTGSGNVFLGYNAGYNETGSNKLHIANNSSSTLIYGNFGSSTVGIGTITPSTALVVIGTVTATGFVGDGSQLTGISASSVGGNSVSSSSIIDGSITGSDLASTLNMTTQAMNIGSITVNAGSFRVDSTGSITATTITSTGSVTASAITTTGTLTASGNLNIDSSTLFVDSVNNRVGVGTTTPSTTLAVNGTVTVTGGYYGYNGIVLNSEGGSSPSKGIRLTNGINNSYVNTNVTGTLEYNTEVDHVFYTGASTEQFRIVSTTGNVGIGTSTPQTKLHVIGTVTATGFMGDGSQLTGISASSVGGNSVSSSSIIDGSITGSDMASTLSMSTKSLDIGSITVNAGNFRVDSAGSMTASSITSTGTVTVSGNKIKTNAYSDTNTFIGVGAGSATTTGYSNTAHGYKSLYSNTTGIYNTAIGDSALYSNTTGDHNTASGYLALYSNTTGAYNGAYGYNALYSNTTGYWNNAYGSEALYSNTTGIANVASGNWALYSNTTGSRNVADGYAALYYNLGSYNTAIGHKAGYNCTGTGSVFLGYEAGYYETGSNKLYIANGSSSTLIYGDFSTTKVGIGTTTPTAMFTVGSGTPSVITSAGSGTVFITSTLEIGGNAYMPGGGSWASASDKRLKRYINPLTGALDKLTQLEGVTYEWIHPEMHGNQRGVQAGLIAQDVEKVFPEWVNEVNVNESEKELIADGGKVKTLKFPHGFNAYLIEAIKELKAENDALKARLSALEDMVGAYNYTPVHDTNHIR